MKTLLHLLVSSVLLSALAEAKSSITLNINDTDVEAGFETEVNRLFDYSSGTTYKFDASLLYSDGERLFTLAFSGNNTFQGVNGLHIGIGLKTVVAQNYLSLPLFASLRYFLSPSLTLPPLYIDTAIAYAPKVLSFSDGVGYYEFRIQGGMEVISNVHIYAGYRSIDTDYHTNDYTFNNSWYGGLKLSF